MNKKTKGSVRSERMIKWLSNPENAQAHYARTSTLHDDREFRVKRQAGLDAYNADYGRRMEAAIKMGSAVRVTSCGATTQFLSVREAFDVLLLPLGKHIPFRMRLKDQGKQSITNADGVEYRFTCVPKS